METYHTLNLIDGVFSSTEANDVLVTLLRNKINFHNLEIFSLEERNGENIERSKKRLEELKQTNEKLVEIIRYAEKNDKVLKVLSSINIEVINKK
jgi:hypothetical protein